MASRKRNHDRCSAGVLLDFDSVHGRTGRHHLLFNDHQGAVILKIIRFLPLIFALFSAPSFAFFTSTPSVDAYPSPVAGCPNGATADIATCLSGLYTVSWGWTTWSFAPVYSGYPNGAYTCNKGTGTISACFAGGAVIHTCATGTYDSASASCLVSVTSCPVGMTPNASGICDDPCANTPDVTVIVPANYSQPSGYLGEAPFPSVTYAATCGTMYMKNPESILCDGVSKCLITYGAGSKGAAAVLAASPSTPATCTALGLGYASSDTKTVCVGGGSANPSAPAPVSGVSAATSGTQTTATTTRTVSTTDPATGVTTTTTFTTAPSGSGGSVQAPSTTQPPPSTSSIPAIGGTALPTSSNGSWYVKTYTNGIQGVMTSNFNTLKATPLAGLINNIVPTISGGAHTGCFTLSVWHQGNQTMCLPAGVLNFLGICIVLTALFTARSIIFGG